MYVHFSHIGLREQAELRLMQQHRYFSHSTYVGLSVFRQTTTTEAERNASFTALGVLTPRSNDGLGAIWMHADPLRKLSEALDGGPENLGRLDSYWKTLGKLNETSDRPPERPRSSASLHRTETGSFDPRHTITSVLDEFGPLIFPLWRAALLRQRVLIIKQPPLRRSCETGIPMLVTGLQ